MSTNNIEGLSPFKIDNIDPLGQGVSKENGQIIFIKKTLPGETGTAKIFKKKKNVHFAKLESLEEKSDIRVTPDCPHYSECNGCSFLHTDYENEIQFKLNTLARAFQIDNDKVEVVKASERNNYRNRIQLHYDKQKENIGFLDESGKKIIPIENCLLAKEEIQEKLPSFMKSAWKNIVSKQPPKGHIELYYKDGGVKITPNENYSQGGFTQVNEEMNDVLKEILLKSINESKPNSILDLFAGDGNLTMKSGCQDICFIDSYPHDFGENFYNLNLYKSLSLEIFKKRSHKTSFDLMVTDPPRAGFKNIDEWVTEFKPQSLIYVSCNHQTLVRDLSKLEDYSLEKLYLIDLFPSTYHFETLAVLSRK